jgi:superfamily II DNA or RNA helicase
MKTVIKIQNNYSWLQSENLKVMNDLTKLFKVRELNYMHSRLFKQKVWDGFTDFFKEKTGRFLTGLLPEVTAALKYWNIQYETIDKRTEVNIINSKIDKDFLKQWNPNFELYDYQVDLINQFMEYKRGIVSAATGAGKSEILVGSLRCLSPKTPCLILAGQTSLVDQNYEKLKEWKFEKVGRVYGNYFEPNVITCSTIQSIHKIESLLPHIKCVIVDEIHEMMGKTCKKAYEKLTNASMRLAISATWEKFGGKDKSQRYYVKGYFGPVLKTNSDVAEKGVVKTKLLQERGTLAKSDCYFYHINEPELPYEIYRDAVTAGIANNYYLHEIVKRLTTLCKGRTLILVERIEHGNILNDIITDSIWIKGKDTLKTRKEVIQRLHKSSKEDVVAIATQKILNSGINCHLHNLINCAGGKADHTIIQRMGRGLRPSDDKEELKYYDFIFNINPYLLRHSNQRVKILKNEGHKITIKKEIDF